MNNKLKEYIDKCIEVLNSGDTKLANELSNDIINEFKSSIPNIDNNLETSFAGEPIYVSEVIFDLNKQTVIKDCNEVFQGTITDLDNLRIVKERLEAELKLV